ncbi:MAG: hypothetical protein L0209_03185, partial [candidate division Zixibacteria bacterium]|nr:hypothetical protein [candidate division Zixibacteria bacterium]
NGRVIRNTNKYELFQNGRLVATELFDYYERFYELAEFEAMLQEAGFTHIQAVRAYDGSEPAEHDGIVFTATNGRI